jgi:hypothetical protein
MAKGTALFETVAISNTRAEVRAGWGGDASRADARGGGCRRTGCGADCGGHGCVGCVQEDNARGVGGVVSMDDGAVTFKGGTISNTKAVRPRLSRSRGPRRMLRMRMLCAS